MAKFNINDALKKAGDVAKKVAEKPAVEESETEISPENAVKVFYYLMAIDRKITPEEEEKFALIGREMDPDFEAHREALVKECKEQLEKIIDAEDYYDAVRDGVDTALSEKQTSDNGFVSPKLLLWDLLTIAYGDDECSEEERKLIKYIVRKLDVVKDVFLEMESSILTVQDIEGEIAWIKGTDRAYLSIEKQVQELEKRREDILFAVKALIML